jgi:hypothetical protein
MAHFPIEGAVRSLFNFVTDSWPLLLDVQLCDLRRRFIPKQGVDRGCRAVARNGRVLLASDLPLAELPGRSARVRLQTWHKAILPGDDAEPYGILLVVRTLENIECSHVVELVDAATARRDWAVDVGGGSLLEFRCAGG